MTAVFHRQQTVKVGGITEERSAIDTRNIQRAAAGQGSVDVHAGRLTQQCPLRFNIQPAVDPLIRVLAAGRQRPAIKDHVIRQIKTVLIERRGVRQRHVIRGITQRLAIAEKGFTPGQQRITAEGVSRRQRQSARSLFVEMDVLAGDGAVERHRSINEQIQRRLVVCVR